MSLSLDEQVEMVATYLAISMPTGLREFFDGVEPNVDEWGRRSRERWALAGIEVPDGPAPSEAEIAADEDRCLRADPIGATRTPVDFCELRSVQGGRHYAVARLRVIPARMYRGQFAFHRCLMELTAAYLHKDGDYEAPWRAHVGYRGGRWRAILPEFGHVAWLKEGIPATERWLAQGAADAVQLQALRERQWRVFIGYEGHPRAGLVVGPGGVQDMFRLRDIPEGKKRRAALKHWVREHWRQRHGAEDASKVRAHLRGQTEFVWNGLRCSLRLPDPDIDMFGPASQQATGAQP